MRTSKVNTLMKTSNYQSSAITCVSVLLLLVTCSIMQSLHAQDLAQMKNAKPFDIQGDLQARAIFYNVNGIAPRYLPFNYLISGSPTVSIYNIQIPIYFSISRQQSSFTQPFNQFGLSPTYKWITLHGGYRNLQYSPFTLAGHTFLGGGVDLHPGKLRVSAMYGRFNKATVLDTLQGLYTENFSYKRMGYAAKVGYGTDKSFIDFSMLHAKDDEQSRPAAGGDLLDSLKITPAENVVAGFQTRLSFLQNRLVFESDAAVSVYTTDARLGSLEDSVSTLDVGMLDKLTTINYSSEIYSAIQASVSYKVKRLGMKIQYRRIDPGYKSMGSYFLNNDLENITLNPSVVTWKGKIRMTGSIGFQHDNLQDKKRATASRVIGAASLSADFTENWGVDISYTNFSNTQRANTLRFADSLRVAQSTQNASFSPRFLKVTPLHSHSVILALNFNTFKELNSQRSLDDTGNDILTQIYFATYQIGFTASQSSVYATVNHAELGNDRIEDKNTGLTIGGTKSWLGNKVLVTASSGYILQNRNGGRGYILNESLQGRYTFLPKHSLQLMMVYIGNYPDAVSEIQRKFMELRVEIGYNFNF